MVIGATKPKKMVMEASRIKELAIEDRLIHCDRTVVSTNYWGRLIDDALLKDP